MSSVLLRGGVCGEVAPALLAVVAEFQLRFSGDLDMRVQSAED